MNDDTTNSVSRRGFVRTATVSGATLAAGLALPQTSSAATLATGKRRVAIFGAGMSGLVAAHELVERGFQVHVFERRKQLGGKARSFPVPNSATGGRKPLPAEHGFRFFPGFYNNVPDSMTRIPRPGRRDTAYDSLTKASEFDGFGLYTTYGEHQGFGAYAPFNQPADLTKIADPGYLAANVASALSFLGGMPAAQMPTEMADFVSRVLVYVTSSEARRKGQWDHVSWWDFTGAANKSRYFQDAVVKGLTQDLVAVKAHRCATSSGGNIVDAFLWNALGYKNGPYSTNELQFLDGPTSDVWLNPWVRHLTNLGVTFHPGHALTHLNVQNGRIASARVRDQQGFTHRVDADWFLSALPIDKARPILLQDQLLRLDPKLEGLKHLTTDWMNGLQIYLKQRPEKVRGVIGTLDHSWTLSAVTQSLLWDRAPTAYGDGTVAESLSIDISCWDDGSATTLVRKAARDCTKHEVFKEIWATMKDRFGALDPAFRDSNVHSWYLDPAVTWSGGRCHNDEALTVQTPGTWAKRPSGATGIPNLFVAGDWIKNAANVACMEAGNYSGRAAAQALLEASHSARPGIPIYGRLAPEQLDPIKQQDAERYRAGLPNMFEPGAGVLRAGSDLNEIVVAEIKHVLGVR